MPLLHPIKCRPVRLHCLGVSLLGALEELLIIVVGEIRVDLSIVFLPLVRRFTIESAYRMKALLQAHRRKPGQGQLDGMAESLRLCLKDRTRQQSPAAIFGHLH